MYYAPLQPSLVTPLTACMPVTPSLLLFVSCSHPSLHGLRSAATICQCYEQPAAYIFLVFCGLEGSPVPKSGFFNCMTLVLRT